MNLLGPLIVFDVIDAQELNAQLIAWEHKDGPLRRPEAYGFWAYGLREHGRLVGVCAASALITPHCAGGLTRAEAVELSRVCAARRDLCRVIVRLWREFAFPALCLAHGYRWAVSYQDRRRSDGDLYRFDGWVPLAASSSGTDSRGGVTESRPKVVWGWHPIEAERVRRRRPIDTRRRAA